MLYAELPKYAKEMTKQELLEFFPQGTIKKTKVKNGVERVVESPKYTIAFLMRSLIMNDLKHSHHVEPRTLRNLWYKAIKPVLSRLDLLDEKDAEEDELRRWDARLSNYVCDLLRRGLLTFSDLGIQDISRMKSTPRQTFYGIGGQHFSYKGNVTPYPNILIATEKDTVYSLISSIATLYGCSSISCKGQNSLGAMELVVKNMFREDLPEFNTIHILTMTDYDPAGYYIAEALEKQVYDILYALGHDHVNVETHRIGITPDQLTEEEVYQNMYTPKKANIDKWMEKTGGINGEEKGLELDAFSNSQIRDIFVENLKEFIDESLYKTFIKESYIKMKVLEAIKDRVDRLTERVTDEMIDQITMKEFDIHKFAKRGQRTLYVDELCESDMDDLIDQFCQDNL